MTARVGLGVGYPGDFDGTRCAVGPQMLPNEGRPAGHFGPRFPGAPLDEVVSALACVGAGLDADTVLGSVLQRRQFGSGHQWVHDGGVSLRDGAEFGAMDGAVVNVVAR